MPRALDIVLAPMRATLFATVAAIAVQPFVFVLLIVLPLLVVGSDIPLTELFGILLYSALISAPFVAAIGIPSLFVLRRFDCLSWQSLGAVGFIFSAIPIAIYGWSEYPGYSSAGDWYGTSVIFVVEGRKTFYGWVQYARDILLFAIHGLVGGLVFYFVWCRAMRSDKSIKVTVE